MPHVATLKNAYRDRPPKKKKNEGGEGLMEIVVLRLVKTLRKSLNLSLFSEEKVGCFETVFNAH